MKALRYIISGVAAAAVLGLLYYQGFVTHTLTSGNLMRAVLILAGLLLALLRPRRKYLSALKPLYQKNYGEFIQGAFSDDPKLENKLKEVLASTNIDESRILTEAAIFADKVAVDEETVRLRSHLQQMYGMLHSGGAVGRKLDFLLQEMNREANTIGSKCTDVQLARIVVEIKAELEKIREQTQNIE